MKIAQNVGELIGKTPLVKINKMADGLLANVYAKLEYFNPGSSVKDRIGMSMIEYGELKGLVKKDTVIIEPSSGNTGIGLALACSIKGYRLIITMPESMSIERRKMLLAMGAELVLTPKEKGMNGAIERAKELVLENPNSYMPLQFANEANPEIHRKTTAVEIWDDTDGLVDIFVAGVGTGGTLTGVGEVLKGKKSSVKCIAVEPAESAVLSGNSPSPHKIQGIGAGFVPAILNTSIIDEIFQVSGDDAIDTAKRMIKEEAILCGISSGANCYTALELAKRPENSGKTIVFIVCDTAERYLSTDLFSS